MKINKVAVDALTDAARAWDKDRTRAYEEHLFDDDIPGFRVRRVGKGVSYIFCYRIAGKQRSITIGKAGVITLTNAREAASKLHAKVKLGGDPAAEKATARAAQPAATTFRDTLDPFLKRQKERLRPSYYGEVERYLLKNSQPLHGRTLDEIDQRAVAALRLKIKEGHGPAASNGWRAALSSFFVWAIKEGLVGANPVIATNKEEDKKRERVLAPEELRAIWGALGAGEDFTDIVRLLMLTGARRDEIGSLAWGEVDFERGLVALPGSRTKNKRPFDLPLSAPTLAILQRRKGDLRDNRSYVFGRGHGGFSGWSACKERLAARLAEARGEAMADWWLHDFRRTLSTVMHEQLGIQPHIVEAVLNHISGHQGGVAGVYNRAAYSVEKRRALDLWAEWLLATVEGRESNVVALHGHATKVT